MSATVTSTTATTMTPTMTMTTTSSSSSTSVPAVSAVSAHLLVDFAWDELDLPLDGDVGADLPGHLLALLDRLLDGLLLGDVGAALLRVLTTLSARHLHGLLAALLVWLGLTGLDRDLATALFGLLTAFGCSVAPSVGWLGGFTFSHVLRGAFVLIGCAADLEIKT